MEANGAERPALAGLGPAQPLRLLLVPAAALAVLSQVIDGKGILLASYFCVRYVLPAAMALWFAKRARKHWGTVVAVPVLTASYVFSLEALHQLWSGPLSTYRLQYPFYSGLVHIPSAVGRWVHQSQATAAILTRTLAWGPWALLTLAAALQLAIWVDPGARLRARAARSTLWVSEDAARHPSLEPSREPQNSSSATATVQGSPSESLSKDKGTTPAETPEQAKAPLQAVLEAAATPASDATFSGQYSNEKQSPQELLEQAGDLAHSLGVHLQQRLAAPQETPSALQHLVYLRKRAEHLGHAAEQRLQTEPANRLLRLVTVICSEVQAPVWESATDSWSLDGQDLHDDTLDELHAVRACLRDADETDKLSSLDDLQEQLLFLSAQISLHNGADPNASVQFSYNKLAENLALKSSRPGQTAKQSEFYQEPQKEERSPGAFVPEFVKAYDQLAEAKIKIGTLTEEVSTLQQDQAALGAAVAEHLSAKHDLQNEVDRLQAVLADTADEAMQAKRLHELALEQLTTALKTALTEKDLAEKLLEERTASMVKLKQEDQDNSSKQLQNLLTELESTRQSLRTLQDKNSGLMDRINEADEGAFGMTEALTVLENKHRKETVEQTALYQKMHMELDESNAQLNGRLEQLTSDHEKLQDTHRALQQAYDTVINERAELLTEENGAKLASWEDKVRGESNRQESEAKDGFDEWGPELQAVFRDTSDANQPVKDSASDAVVLAATPAEAAPNGPHEISPTDRPASSAAAAKEAAVLVRPVTASAPVATAPANAAAQANANPAAFSPPATVPSVRAVEMSSVKAAAAEAADIATARAASPAPVMSVKATPSSPVRSAAVGAADAGVDQAALAAAVAEAAVASKANTAVEGAAADSNDSFEVDVLVEHAENKACIQKAASPVTVGVRSSEDSPASRGKDVLPISVVITGSDDDEYDDDESNKDSSDGSDSIMENWLGSHEEYVSDSNEDSDLDFDDLEDAEDREYDRIFEKSVPHWMARRHNWLL